MSECETGRCETDESCGPSHAHGSDECTMAEDLLCLAKSAKHELLKEKMKKIFEAKMGKKLDKLAEAAVDAVIACVQQKIAAKQACSDYEQKLTEALKG